MESEKIKYKQCVDTWESNSGITIEDKLTNFIEEDLDIINVIACEYELIDNRKVLKKAIIIYKPNENYPKKPFINQ